MAKVKAHRIDAGRPAVMSIIIRQWPKPSCLFFGLCLSSPSTNLYHLPNPQLSQTLKMSFYNFNLTAQELNSLPKHLHPEHMFAIAELLSVLRRAYEDQNPELHRKGLLAATVSPSPASSFFPCSFNKAPVLPLMATWPDRKHFPRELKSWFPYLKKLKTNTGYQGFTKEGFLTGHGMFSKTPFYMWEDGQYKADLALIKAELEVSLIYPCHNALTN